jgi:hypothetical protein
MIAIVGTVLACVVLAIIVTMLLRRHLREKYAIVWLVIGTLFLVLAVVPGLLAWTARLFGVQVPSNLLFALAIMLLVGVALHLSWELSTAEDEARRLAEEAALTRAALDSVERRVSRLEGGARRPCDEPKRVDPDPSPGEQSSR